MDITSYLLGKQAGGGGGQPSLQSKSVTITENGTQNVTADSGYDGLRNVSVTTNVSGGGGLDWSAIGYSEEPELGVDDGYNYAIEIKNNWVPATSLLQKFVNNRRIMFMPLVDTSITTTMTKMFRNCFTLVSIPQLNTSQVTDMEGLFDGCYNLQTIPLLNTSNVTTMKSMFSTCYRLKEIPQFDTSNVTDMYAMFNSCEKLANVPQLNTSNVTNMTSMFNGCYSLNDTSLDNILKMCINAVSYTGTKTLKFLGFQYQMTTYYPASKIQALPHYQDFINAGWTIGY